VHNEEQLSPVFFEEVSIGLLEADCRPLFSHETTNFFACKSASGGPFTAIKSK